MASRAVRTTAALLTGIVVTVGGTAGWDARPAGASFAPCVAAQPADAGLAGWAAAWLAPQQVWARSAGAGVTVAVVDSGVDGALPALAGRVRPGFNAVSGGEDADVDADCNGRGTLMAALIAAQAGDGAQIGLAPAATIFPVRLADGDRVADPQQTAAGIDRAVQAGIAVLALGPSAPIESPAVAQAIERAIERRVVVVVGAAAGGAAGLPAAAGLLRVGGVDTAGRHVAAYGAGTVDVVAPAAAITSLAAGATGPVAVTGTEYAVALVAGVAALVRAAAPTLDGRQAAQRITETASRSTEQIDARYGWGLVNPRAAVADDLPAAPAAQPGSSTGRLLLVILAVLVLAAVGGVLWWRRVRAGRAGEPDASPPAAEPDDPAASPADAPRDWAGYPAQRPAETVGYPAGQPVDVAGHPPALPALSFASMAMPLARETPPEDAPATASAPPVKAEATQPAIVGPGVLAATAAAASPQHAQPAAVARAIADSNGDGPGAQPPARRSQLRPDDGSGRAAHGQSTPEQRQLLRRMLGPRYAQYAQVVINQMAQRPGLKPGEGERVDAVVTELVAVVAFGAGDEIFDQARPGYGGVPIDCLNGGARRLPTHLGAALATWSHEPQLVWELGAVLRADEPLAAQAPPGRPGLRRPLLAVLSVSGRRSSGLMDGREQVLFVPGTRFRVVGVEGLDPSRPTVVMLRELAAVEPGSPTPVTADRDERALQSLRRVINAKVGGEQRV